MAADENDTVNDAIDQALPDASDDLETLAAETQLPKPAVAALDSERRKRDASQRQKDREAGRASFQQALDKRAQSLGFQSVEEMLQVAGTPVKAPASAPATRQPQEPKSSGSESKSSALQAEVRRSQEENKSLQNQIRGLRSRISSLETELELRQVAYDSDVNSDDMDYALSQLNTHYRKLDETAAKSFDPKKFFAEDLRKKKPGIFRQAMETRKVEEVAVTTAMPGNAPRPPSGPETRGVDDVKPKRATDMSRSEYVEALRRRGITDPATKVH